MPPREPRRRPTAAVLCLATLALAAGPACRSRIVKPERHVQVVADTPQETRVEIVDEVQEQPSMITSEGKMVKMYYVRHKAGTLLQQLISETFGKDYIHVTVKSDFQTYDPKAGLGSGGLDLMLLTGDVGRIAEMDNFIALVEADVLQVEINVKVVELTHTDVNERGVNVGLTEVNPSNPNTLFNTGNAAFSSHEFLKSSGPAGISSGPLAFQGTRVLLDTIQHDLKLDLAIELLKRFQQVEVLSAPTIRVLNGHPAYIKTGERTPVQTVNFNKSGIAAINTTFTDTGVTLTVTPTVVAEDTIRLQIKPEVSSVTSFSNPATSGGFAVPFISTRTAQTVVNVRSGEVFALGGLFATTQIVSESKFPILGDIPILGALFSSSNKQNVQSEIIFFLEPKIIYPRTGARGRLILPPEERK